MHNIELKILIGLHRNVRSLDKKTSDIAAKYNLTFSQFMVLEALYSKGDMSVGEVRDYILSSVGTIPLVVKNLEKMDLITRRIDEKDKRISILHLSEKGKEIIQEVAPQNEQMVLEYISVLSEEEKKQMVSLLKKIGGKNNEERN
ncbi:MAG TPA: MarR family transcriptional regulator [Candidatus Dorea intestinavium]|nr:MarR family transcriptional regulator [Candidatus Dorea intestinavium]